MRSRAAVVVGVLSAALVSGGWLLERGIGGGTSIASRRQLFSQVYAHVQSQFVDSLSDSALYRKAVDGMLHELRDPHTVYLSADRYNRLRERTVGNYAGIGVQIDVRDGWPTVVAPMPNSPAAVAGIEIGDRLVEVNGLSTKGWTVDEMSRAVRGPPGSSVSLRAERPGVPARLPYTLVRREIAIRSVPRATLVAGPVGYVAVSEFSESTERDLRAAVDSLRSAGMTSLILDLRGNPGGLLDQGVKVTDLFLDPGQKIVTVRGRTPESVTEFTDRAPQAWATLPIVVLVNAGSASASEIVAGALQDHDRAVLVGATTYGKGSAQSVIPMDFGSALKLTIARWYTPVGRSISKPMPVDNDEARDPRAGSTAAPRPTFHTDAGRIVLGGGGITPDVTAGDTVPSDVERDFQRALGTKLPLFRDAIADYAATLKATHALASPDFDVTPAMRDELFRRMVARGIVVTRATYDAASGVVDLLLGAEAARYLFGREVEFRRRAKTDPVMQKAIALLSGARTPQDLLARAAAEPAPKKAGP